MKTDINGIDELTDLEYVHDDNMAIYDVIHAKDPFIAHNVMHLTAHYGISADALILAFLELAMDERFDSMPNLADDLL